MKAKEKLRLIKDAIDGFERQSIEEQRMDIDLAGNLFLAIRALISRGTNVDELTGFAAYQPAMIEEGHDT